MGASFVLAVVSTVGDYIWARWFPTHQTHVGIAHGVILCLIIGAVLGGYRRTLAAMARGAGAALVVGLVASVSFYLLFPLFRWTAMFLSWMLLWVLMALAFRWAAEIHQSPKEACLRGLVAAVLSGLAFYAISGIWLEPAPDGPDYPVHLVSWWVAFLPGYLPLLLKAGGSTPDEPT